jgi:hypothetical protein
MPRSRSVRYVGGPQRAKTMATKAEKARSLVNIVLPVSGKQDKETRLSRV